MESIPSFGIVREDEERRDGGCAIAYNPETQKFAVGTSKEKPYYSLFGGGFDEGESPEQGVLRELREESGLFNYAQVEKVGEANARYFNRLKKVNRVAHTTCYLVVLASIETKEKALEEHEDYELIFVTKEQLIKNWNESNQDHDVDHWLYYLEKAHLLLKGMGYGR